MHPRIYHKPAELGERDWNEILVAFASNRHLPSLQLLQKKSNAPQSADMLFPNQHVNDGHERVNAIFRGLQLPYRMVRIGSWAFEESRSKRRLALVRWDASQQLKLPLVPFQRQRRSGNRP